MKKITSKSSALVSNLPHLKTFRKTLRNNLTPAEAKLWTLLKGKQLDGKKFRRQFSVANYILDFYCPDEHLAIELDGQGHFEASQAEYDITPQSFGQLPSKGSSLNRRTKISRIMRASKRNGRKKNKKNQPMLS